ncbi:MAG: TonB-dependent receptor [Deltaproteobacteria bacterium]|nr:TonB-dependent receptor [Deltaproteobacteria bacterium]
MVLIFFLLISIFLSRLSTAAEPEQDETLAPVVVTATRIETAQEQTTTSISVITAKDIEARQAETVLEVLRTVSGVDMVQAGSRGNATSVFIRGSESDDVLVLIDGVEVNSTTLGSFDFAHLTTDNIERIEVVRGAGGTLYGSQAVGGVINILTKRGEAPPQLTFSAEGGNGHTHRQALTLRGGTGKLGYSLSAARFETQGFHRFNDDYRNLATSARLDYRLMDASLKGIFHFVKTDLGLFNNNNFASAPDPNAREAAERYLGKLEWEQRIFKEWDYRISGSIFKEHIKDSDDVDSCVIFGFPCDSRTRDRFRPNINTGEFQTNYRIEDWSTTTFGVEYKLRQASTSGGIERSVRNLGYYLQEQIHFLDRRLILVPGVRLDDNQSFGTAWTPSFSAAYLFKETGTKVKGGYAQGFKAPTLNELFFPPAFGCPAFGNPDLSPERSWELNAGVEQGLLRDRFKIGATYFHREIRDLIEGRPIPGDPFGCFRAANVGRARFDGVEWNLNVRIFSSLSLNAQYTYLDWDTEDGTLPRRPRHRGNVNLNYHHENLEVNLFANIVGKRDDFDATTFADIQKPGYTRFDLAGSYRLPVRIALMKSMSLFGKIENLWNKKYEEADGFRARPLNFMLGIQGVLGKN